jgi:hypothetical protein
VGSSCSWIWDGGPWDELFDEEGGGGQDAATEDGGVEASLNEDEGILAQTREHMIPRLTPIAIKWRKMGNSEQKSGAVQDVKIAQDERSIYRMQMCAMQH